MPFAALYSPPTLDMTLAKQVYWHNSDVFRHEWGRPTALIGWLLWQPNSSLGISPPCCGHPESHRRCHHPPKSANSLPRSLSNNASSGDSEPCCSYASSSWWSTFTSVCASQVPLKSKPFLCLLAVALAFLLALCGHLPIGACAMSTLEAESSAMVATSVKHIATFATVRCGALPHHAPRRVEESPQIKPSTVRHFGRLEDHVNLRGRCRPALSKRLLSSGGNRLVNHEVTTNHEHSIGHAYQQLSTASTDSVTEGGKVDKERPLKHPEDDRLQQKKSEGSAANETKPLSRHAMNFSDFISQNHLAWRPRRTCAALRFLAASSACTPVERHRPPCLRNRCLPPERNDDFGRFHLAALNATLHCPVSARCARSSSWTVSWTSRL